MPDGKNTVTKPPEPKAPAALSKASNENEELIAFIMSMYKRTRQCTKSTNIIQNWF